MNAHPITSSSNPAALPYTPEVARATAEVQEKLQRLISPQDWAIHAPYIAAINELKKQRNAVILAHNYQTPAIYHGVADLTGDSLALARMAINIDADVVVMCGVHFMAETAKILNPSKTVLIPDMKAGCSLADSITANDIRLLRQRYPGVPVVTYVNTSAEVKAESDVCCTSANAVKIVEGLGVDRVIFLPDEYLGQYVASKTKVQVILWKGHCMVHERFTGLQLKSYRARFPGIQIIAHPECPQDVLQESDYVGSTAGMISYVDTKRPPKVLMVTECSMSDCVSVNFPDVEFVRPCTLCPHMQRITLPKILTTLQDMSGEVFVDPEISARAKLAVDRMLALS
jgi:quinolinate synthase